MQVICQSGKLKETYIPWCIHMYPMYLGGTISLGNSVTGVDMRLHYDIWLAWQEWKGQHADAKEGTLQKTLQSFMWKSHLEISKSLTANTLRSWHKGQHCIHHIFFPIQGLLDEVHFSCQVNVPCLRPCLQGNKICKPHQDLPRNRSQNTMPDKADGLGVYEW